MVNPGKSVSDPSSDVPIEVAALLALSGGFLDVFTFVAHGGVFVNTMTGNIVFLGINIAQGQRDQALLNLPSLVAFLTGIFIAYYMHLPKVLKYLSKPALTCLGIEILVLSIAIFIPNTFPDALLVFSIAVAASMQNFSFNKLGKREYNSIVTTGNLRIFAEAFFKGNLPNHNPRELHQAKMFGLVCLCFLIGTILAASLTSKSNNYTLLIPIAQLALAFFICWRQQSEFRRLRS